jgi:hypothetical protein
MLLAVNMLHLFESLSLLLATQPSTYMDNSAFAASKAIDGSNSTFSHTDASSQFSQQWTLYWDEEFDIQQITILNRGCGTNDESQCMCRLSNATLALTNKFNMVEVRNLGDNLCNTPVVIETFSSQSCPISPTPSPTLPCYHDVKRINIDRRRRRRINGQVAQPYWI